MHWGTQESESTQAVASAALTPKHYNVQVSGITRDGEGSKSAPSRERDEVPALTIAINHSSDLSSFLDSRRGFTAHLVALFLATKTDIRRPVSRGQPWSVMLVNSCRPRKCAGQSLSYACDEV